MGRLCALDTFLTKYIKSSMGASRPLENVIEELEVRELEGNVGCGSND